MTEVKHTPTPWELCEYKRPESYHIRSASRHWSVASAMETEGCSDKSKDIPDSEAKANAAHIVKCVNMHDELVEALKKIIDRSHNDPLGTSKVIDMRKIAETALRKAGAL